MTERRKLAIVALAGLAIVAARHPTPTISLLTHDIGDPQPHRVQAALDLGLVGVSILYTWTARRT
jgi:hypothetical protein